MHSIFYIRILNILQMIAIDKKNILERKDQLEYCKKMLKKSFIGIDGK